MPWAHCLQHLCLCQVILLLIVMLCGNVLYQLLRKGETSKVDDSKTVEALGLCMLEIFLDLVSLPFFVFGLV